MNCKLKVVEFKMKNLSVLIDSVAKQNFLVWGQYVPRRWALLPVKIRTCCDGSKYG